MMAVAILALAGTAAASCEGTATYAQLLRLPHTPPDLVSAYGPAPEQVGELWLPHGPAPFPVVVVLHGGCWFASVDRAYLQPLAARLASAGFAVWLPEYRRLGSPGGGWPGTFQDAAAAVDHLRVLAEGQPLDLTRVVVLGHSAGGHLALWLAARPGLPPDTPVSSPDPFPLRGVVSLAGIPDLQQASLRGVCGSAPSQLLGDDPQTTISLASPAERLPLNVPQRLLGGDCDGIVPPDLASGFALRAVAAGDQATARILPGANHFDLVDPTGAAWTTVLSAVRRLVAPPRPVRPAAAAD